VGATLEGLNVGISFSISGFFDDATKVVPVNQRVTVDGGIELTYAVSARILSDTDGDGDMEPVPGVNGLLNGIVTVDISGNEIFAKFDGTAQPAGFTITITDLKPEGYAPGTIQDAGGMSGVNVINAPGYDAATSTLTLSWTFLGFQPETVVTQTVVYDNQLADAPVAGDDAFETKVGTALTGKNVLANDTDLDNMGAIGVVDLLSVKSVDGIDANVGQWVDLEDGGKVKINADGSLSFDDDGDFSHLSRGHKQDVTFNYIVKDSTGLTDEGTVTITVEGTNSKPTAVLPSTMEIAENAPATEVAGVSIGDADGDAQTVTLTVADGLLSLGTTTGLSFTSGDGTGDMTMVFSGTIAQINAALATLTFQPNANFTGSSTIQIATTDGNGGSSNGSISVVVTDVDPVLAGDIVSIDENSVDGTVVHTMSVSNDTNGLTYSIVSGNEDGAFRIDSNTGEIIVLDGSKLNYESAVNSYNLVIGVDDEDGDTIVDATALVTINLNDVNDAPVITSVNAVSVQENMRAVLTVSASDEDRDDLTYSIAGGDDAVRFAIDPTTGALMFIAAPDFEIPVDADSDNVYEVEVQATDSHGLSVTQLINVTVTDKSDELAPTVTVNTLRTTDTTPAISGTIDDDHATIEVTIAGQTYNAVNNADGTWTLADNTITALAPGTYDVAVVAKDLADNIGADTSTGELVIIQSGSVDPDKDKNIVGGNGDDIIKGGTGDDTLIGGGGNDRISGGDGNDTIGGGKGADTIFGGDGNDLIFGGPDDGRDQLYGGAGADKIWSGGGDDQSYGGAGDDTVGGGNGNDTVGGGKGNDKLYGGAGDDVLYGGADNDIVSGGAGNDNIWGGEGNDTLSGGAGSDVFHFKRGHGVDIITDFEIKVDKIDLSFLSNHGDTLEFSDLDITVSGGSTTILVDGLEIRLRGTTGVTAGDFIF